MAIIKSFTDLSQSKVLAEFLPLESADMYYSKTKILNSDETDYIVKVGTSIVITDVPCWSLAALLQVLPLGIYDEFDNCDYELEIDMIDKMPRYIRLGDIYHSKFPYDFEKDTLLDNVVESIIWLNDNNYFEL